MEQFTMNTTLPSSPEAIFKTWFSSEGHSAMTGSPAQVEPDEHGKFTAWDGYIWGKTLEVEAPERFVQAWRTSEFPEDSPDSRVEVHLKAVPEGTEVTLVHSDIPDGQAESYRQGWQDFYFTPMGAYFSKNS